MDRASAFTDNFKKAIDLMRENKPKDMPIFVYIYARDPLIRDDDNIDWTISIYKACATKKYNDYYIKQDINEFLSSND